MPKEDKEKISPGVSPESPDSEPGSPEEKRERTQEQAPEVEKGEDKEKIEKEQRESSALEEKKEVSPSAETLPQEQSKERVKEVEKVLEEDLEEVYTELGDKAKAELKSSGEELTQDINTMLERRNLDPNKLHKRIKKWLSQLNTNKHFLDQEAKKKTDKILELRNKEE
mgnify:CR=1 FL=1